eukprot:5798428-Prymnesium_polylepis.2
MNRRCAPGGRTRLQLRMWLQPSSPGRVAGGSPVLCELNGDRPSAREVRRIFHPSGAPRMLARVPPALRCR